MIKLQKIKDILNGNVCKTVNIVFLYLVNFLCFFFPDLSVFSFIISAILITIIFLFYDIEYSIIISSVLLVSDIFNNLNYPISLTFLICTLFVFVYGLKYIRDIFRKTQKPYCLMLIISLLIVLQGFINFDVSNVKTILGDFCMIALIYLVYVNANKLNIKKMILSFTYGFVAVLGISFIFALIPSLSSYVILSNDRFMSFCINPNGLQIFCSITLSLLLLLYLKKDIKFLNFIVLATPFIVSGIFTKSKAFLILLLLLVCLFVVFSFIKDRKKGFISLGVATSVILVAVLLFNNIFIEIFQRFFKYNYDNILDKLLTGRVTIWKKYINHWSDNIFNIIFGIGVTKAPIFTQQAHSVYINLLYHRGIIGVLLIITLIVTFIINTKNKRQRFKLMNIIPIFIFLLLAFEETILNFRYLFLLSFCCLILFSFDKLGPTNVEKQIKKGDHYEKNICNNTSV